jgi:hypothetical protein
MYSNYPFCPQKGRQAIFNIFYTRQKIQSKSVGVNILPYNVCTLSNLSAIYHGESKLIKGPLCTIPIFLCDLHSASSLKQQSADRHVAPLGQIILVSSQSVFALFLNAVRLPKKQQILML